MHSTLARAKLIKALTVGLAAGFFFVAAAPNAAAKEKRQTATAETCPLPFCTTNPGKSCATTSHPNFSYFCGTQKKYPVQEASSAKRCGKRKKTNCYDRNLSVTVLYDKPGKVMQTISDPDLSYFYGTQ